MAEKQTIVIAGASTRAAAFSALRAGLEPFCLDLFADADLRLRCPVIKLDPATYPRNLLKEMRKAPPGPWMYTGGLENHPRLVEAISRERELWGNGHSVLRQSRSPARVEAVLRTTKSPYLISLYPPESNPSLKWLVKPIRGSGGRGIHFWHPDESGPCRGVYYQRYCGDQTVAVIYLRDEKGYIWLDVSQQLVGVSWLNAASFQYCGSIGPMWNLPLGVEQQQFEEIGNALVRGLGLRGLFGVDIAILGCALHPLEINPRYTASIEVLEYATGRQSIWWHQLAFSAPSPAPQPKHTLATVVGKAILFARESFTFPADGPWLADLDPRRPIEEMPAFADIPEANSFIKRAWPVLTFFAKGATVEEVREKLKGIAAQLNERFWPDSGPL